MQRTLVLVLLWICLTAACAIGGAAILNLRKFYLLSGRGVSTQGQITKTEPENHAAIYYSFSVGQQTYSGVGSAGNMNRKFDEVSVGDKVPVVYDPVNPEASCLGDPNKQLTSLTHGVVFISIFPTLSFLVYYVKKRIKKTTDRYERAA